jgi:hypothetical protein
VLHRRNDPLWAAINSQETETEENWANIDALTGISLPKGPYIFYISHV